MPALCPQMHTLLRGEGRGHCGRARPVGGSWSPQAKGTSLCLPTEELELELQNGQTRVRARLSLTEGLSWGPFHGSIQTRASSPGQAEQVRTLVTTNLDPTA